MADDALLLEGASRIAERRRGLNLLNLVRRDVCVDERVMMFYGPAWIVEPRRIVGTICLRIGIPRHE
jgi:hypothetical protein